MDDVITYKSAMKAQTDDITVTDHVFTCNRTLAGKARGSAESTYLFMCNSAIMKNGEDHAGQKTIAKETTDSFRGITTEEVAEEGRCVVASADLGDLDTPNELTC